MALVASLCVERRPLPTDIPTKTLFVSLFHGVEELQKTRNGSVQLLTV